ncbi:MAG: efflux transporter outer membrane subunit [Verrucomicrobia bacterium]|nr:efflux transporter outer membrane subunit [Verrucomicrobiota bacterium]MDA1068050.1 efflux transporter outer membrane subunit [Verrucomicrobiota bacterium]
MSSTIRTLFLITLLTLVAGCATTAPDSQNDNSELQNNVPGDWSQDSDKGKLASDWLRDFEDDNLVSLVETAMMQNPSLQAAVYRLQQAEANAQIAGALQYPSLGLSGSGTKQKVLFNPFGSFTITNYSLSLSSQWELDVWGKVREQHSATLAMFEASGYDMEALRLSLISQISKAWFNAKELLYQRELAVSSAESFDSNLKILEDRYQRGLVQAFDLRLSRSQASVVRAQVSQRESALDQAIRLLETLVGEYPGRTIELSKELPAVSTPIPAGLPASLLEQRPDLRAAERRLAASGANFNAEKKNRLPDISLTGSLGQASNELGNLLDSDSGVWNLAGNITAPVFMAGRLGAQRRQAEAQFNEQVANYESAILNAFREVETALANQTYLVQLVDDLNLAAKQSSKALEQAWVLYGRGLLDISAVLDAERRSFDTRSQSITAINRVLQNRIDLYIALGGGFNLDEE